MKNNDFTTTIFVDQTPAQVFNALLNVRGWWSGLYGESFEGDSAKLDDEFSFRAGNGLHYTRQKLVEFVPNERLVWLVTESNLSFLKNESEWLGTRIRFDLSQENGQTKVVFTHVGLVPESECYDSCAPAWMQYVQENQLNLTQSPDYTTTLVVDKTPEEAFAAINNVRGWWSEEIEGDTDKPGDVFTYHYKDVHSCKMQLAEFVPGKKVVWRCIDNHFSFTEDKSEWIGTKIIFEIEPKGKETEIRFTHQGLVPQYECYEICRDSWDNYIHGSLRSLITTGKGQPNPRDSDREFNENLLKEHGKQ